MQLKPCPFCAGIEVVLLMNMDTDSKRVECESCGAKGPWHWREEDAAQQWNNRHYYRDVEGANDRR